MRSVVKLLRRLVCYVLPAMILCGTLTWSDVQSSQLVENITSYHHWMQWIQRAVIECW